MSRPFIYHVFKVYTKIHVCFSEQEQCTLEFMKEKKEAN